MLSKFFVNEYNQVIQKNGRFSVPKSFREIIGENSFVIIPEADSHRLVCYTIEKFNEIGEEIVKSGDIEKQRSFFAVCEDVKPDSSGRVTISTRTMTLVGFSTTAETKVKIRGIGYCFEIVEDNG